MKWVEELIQKHEKRLKYLRSLPKDAALVPCRICDGTAHPQCGCDGTMTIAEAINDLETELEIFGK